MAHSILQQSIITFFVGLVIGYIAVRTASIIPCILFHFTHNATSVLMSMVDAGTMQQYPLLGAFLEPTEAGVYQYGILPGILMAVVGVLILIWFWKAGVEEDPRSQGGQPVTFQSDKARSLQSFVSKISAK